MSISGISSLGVTQEFQSLIGNSRANKQDPDEFASSIFEKDDADGDGLLSLEETPLDEDKFNTIDTDGDGFISEEELSADFENHMNEMMGQINMQMQGIDPATMAQSIVDKDDADGDGLLSLDETPLDEDRFNSIDADGDGYISAEELSADAQANMSETQEGMGAAPPPPPSEGMAAGGASGSSESQSEEEYDEYDLNEDGQVTLDELLQAFQQGSANLGGLFSNLNDGTVSSMTQRLAMEAYAAQMA